MLDDLRRVEAGAASVRFVVGRFGSGKSFFLSLVQAVALDRKFVVARADVTTDRRLHATGGQARSLYAELMKNLATRGRPDGGALPNLVERWVGDVAHRVTAGGGTEADVARELAEQCRPLRELVGGYDFAAVIAKYYEAFLRHNEPLQAAALRWLRAEYATKSEARQDLGVRSVIDDASVYDFLKLFARFARFVRVAGYAGLLVCLDQLVVLSHRLNNKLARNNNYEAILRILNDCLQGAVEGVGFVFAATDDCLTDPRRGLFSYEALATRLAENRFAAGGSGGGGGGVVDHAGPVLRLGALTPEDCYVLLHNVRRVHALGDEARHALPDEGIEAYLHSCQERMGSAYFQTPRETVKDFVGLLNVLGQNPSADWRALIGGLSTGAPPARDPSEVAATAEGTGGGDDDLATFRL